MNTTSILTRMLYKNHRASARSLNYISHDIEHGVRSAKKQIVPKNAAVAARRLKIFEQEQRRQKELVTRVNKISVQYKGQPDHCTLYMNRGLSTPYDCSRHISKMISDRAVLADVDGQLWDMHRPLEGDVECLQFLHFREWDPYYVNKAFWRSCTLMLGAVFERVFKNSVYVQLCSFPPPNVRSGSFVYDIDLGMEWTPSRDELRVLSGEMVRLSTQEAPFERLSVSEEVASELFRDNRHKAAQVAAVAQSNEGSVVVYRVGDLVDMSRGPMMAHTGQVGRVSVTAVHRVSQDLYRVQGVALPKDIRMNHFSYGILEKRSAKLNELRLPDESDAPQ